MVFENSAAAFTRLFYLRDADSEVISEVQDRLINVLHATTLSRWRVSCKLYLKSSNSSSDSHATTIASTTPSKTHAMYLLSSSLDQDSLYTFILDSGDGQVFNRVGKEFELMLPKFKTLWTHRQSLSIEGLILRLPLCIVRLGTVLVGSMPRGAFLEIQMSDDLERVDNVLRSILHEAPTILQVAIGQVDSAPLLSGEPEIAYTTMTMLKQEGLLAVN